FVVVVFSPGDDPIACLNKAMAFLTTIASLSNPTSSGGNNASGHARVVKCYNCQDEEQLAFLADPGVLDGQAVQIIIPNNAAFQTEDLDTYDSECDDISNAKAVLMANISNYGFDIISEVYKDQFDSIKKTHVRTKEQCDSLIDKLNLKYAKNDDLKAQIQDKGIVKQAKAKQPLDNALALCLIRSQLIQELLVYVQDTCPNAINLNGKKVAVTPKKNVKKVWFSKPLTSSSNIQQVE
ncbi:hypothetical protein Tco_0995571, partial [Tanacetum coccineum]